MRPMTEDERKKLVKNCTKEYYDKDMNILIDKSVVQISSIIFILYNLIYFGNKIYLFRSTFNYLNTIAKENDDGTERSKIRKKNAQYILEAMNRNNYNNYIVIENLPPNRVFYINAIAFLEKTENSICYLSDGKLSAKLIEGGFRKQVVFLQEGMVETTPYQNSKTKFETIGFIKFVEGKMIINKSGQSNINVYDSKGNKKLPSCLQVNIGDYVLIKANKTEKTTYILYEVVNSHTRHQGIRIIWTDVEKGERTNQYIDGLPDKYYKMIIDAID